MIRIKKSIQDPIQDSDGSLISERAVFSNTHIKISLYYFILIQKICMMYTALILG